MDQSIHAKFALSKLIQHRAGSASLQELSEWLYRFARINPDDPSLKASFLYVQLLNPQLASPSNVLDDLIRDAISLNENSNLPQARITLALGHLEIRNLIKHLSRLVNQKIGETGKTPVGLGLF